MVSGVVLAAGVSSRMGQHKLLLPLAGQPLVRRVAGAILEAGFDDVLVVVGHEHARVVSALDGLNVRHVVNLEYAAGMGSSFRTAVAALPDSEAAMFALADQPLLTATDYRRVLDAYLAGLKSGPAQGFEPAVPPTSLRGPALAGPSPSTARGPASASRGPTSAVRGPASARPSPSTARGPASASQGPASASEGPTSAVRGPASASRGPASAEPSPATPGPASAGSTPATARGPASAGPSPGIVCVRYGDVTAPPHLFARRYFAELAQLEHGARPVLQRHTDDTTILQFAPELLLDIDTPDDYERAKALLDRGR